MSITVAVDEQQGESRIVERMWDQDYQLLDENYDDADIDPWTRDYPSR